MLSGGTLDKNISFLFVLSSDENAAFHFESVNARLDNLFGSPWLNVKMGKFELDNIVSEKRGLTLTANGGGFQLYHFVPVGDNNFLGQIGDNQFGLEWMGHSANDRTRLSAAVLSTTDGNPDLPGSNSYTGFFAGSQAFEVGQTWNPACRLLRHGRAGADQFSDFRRSADRGRRVRQQELQSRGLQRNLLPRASWISRS